ncbi:MAG: hypothetical protein ABIO70_21540 [Pseudomonadota bacterium]
MTRVVFALPLVLAAGCYPRIPGAWEDYWVPEKLGIIGVATNTQGVGGYWGDVDDYAEVWWGWVEGGTTSAAALDAYVPGGGCVRNAPGAADLYPLFEDLGVSISQITGSEEHDLYWWEERGIFHQDPARLLPGSYDLAPLETPGYGTISAEGFLQVPSWPSESMSGPSLTGSQPATARLEDIQYTWASRRADFDLMILEVWLAWEDDGWFNTYEHVACVADGEDGRVALDVSRFHDPGLADGAYVFLGPANDTRVRLDERHIASNMLSWERHAGFLFLE